MAGGAIEIRGAETLEALAKRLRAAKATDLRKELLREIRTATKPVVVAQKTRVKGLTGAPKEWRSDAARATRAKTRLTGAGAGVRISVGGQPVGRRAKFMNRGRWRHPLFGNRDRWYDQTVPPGWFDDPARAAGPNVQKAILRAVERISAQIEG